MIQAYNRRMKAISIRQPWAWLIVDGDKTIENRTWVTTYRGPLLIHAGLRVETDMLPGVIQEIKRLDDLNGLPPATPLFRPGGVIGIVDLIDIVTASDNQWFDGPYGWVLANARPLEFHPCRGKLGLFEVEYPLSLTATPQESWLYTFPK